MYVVMDIGCLHCKAPSDLVGVFEKEEHAELAKKEAILKLPQMADVHKIEVFHIPEINMINDYYLTKG